MKKIFIPLIVLAVAGCKDAKNNSVAEAVTSADTVVVVEQIEETEEADAYSSATSKPNEVLFQRDAGGAAGVSGYRDDGHGRNGEEQ